MRRTAWVIIAAAALSSALGGCATVPRPTPSKGSLLVLVVAPERGSPLRHDILTVKGPTRVVADLSSTHDSFLAFSVRPGVYSLASRSFVRRGASLPEVIHYHARSVTIPPSSVVLAPWKVMSVNRTSSTRNRFIGSVRPRDQRQASAFLADHVRIADWAGRRTVGFGPYSPFRDFSATSYRVDIRTTPETAEIWIDRKDWGHSPLVAKLPRGRHFLRLSRAGYRDYRGFIGVEGPGQEHFTLELSPEHKKAARTGTITLAVEPFENLGSRSSNDLTGVLRSSLEAALQKAGVDIVHLTAAHSGADFRAAEKAGAEAFVAGDYVASAKSILIDAALYDTRTGFVKTYLSFRGRAGLHIFDSIDRMSREFRASLEKALPRVGRAVVQERVISPRGVAFDSRLSEQAVIRARNRHRFVVEVGPSLGTVLDNLAPSDNNAPLGVYAGVDAPLFGPLSLHLAVDPFLFRDSVTQSYNVDLPLYAGLRYNFSGYMNDVYVGLQGAVHYIPSVQASVFNPTTGAPQPTTVGPYLLTGLNFETGVRIYTYHRLSRPAAFIGIGLTTGFFGYGFDLSNPSIHEFYPMEAGLRLVFGTRL